MPQRPASLPSILARALLAALLLTGGTAYGEDLSALPDWAAASVRTAPLDAPPADAEAWVLLERTEFGYQGGSEIRIRKFRVVKVLSERGLDEREFRLWGLGGATSKIKKLKGWNLRPDGEITRIDKDDIATFSANTPGTLSTSTLTYGSLPRVVKGSIVAFESHESYRGPLGALYRLYVLENLPIRTWELELSTELGFFTRSDKATVKTRLETRHFSPWLPEPAPGATAIKLSNLPALPRLETGHRDPSNLLPQVFLSVEDPVDPDSLAVGTWDEFSRRYLAFWPPAKAAIWPPAGEPRTLSQLHRWMQRELTYRQVYLTPERGWQPVSAEEVLRGRFGDCKDLTRFFIEAARSAGAEAFPALARIVEGTIEADPPVHPFNFNHVIVAVRLAKSLGMPAEVTTPQGQFLLVDCTDRFTPLGRLSSVHRGGRVLICTPQGGSFAGIPAAAIIEPKVAVDLEGTLDAGNTLTGSMTIREEGDALGLRYRALAGGPTSVKKALAGFLDFPPGSAWELKPMPDPLGEATIFTVALTFLRPKSLVRNGRDDRFTDMGLPAPPRLIQPRGKPRAYPVWIEPEPAWEYDARIQPAGPGRPLNPGAVLDTPLRSAAWTQETRDGRWHLHFTQTSHSLDLPVEQKEAGVLLQKSDRTRFSIFLDNALTIGQSMARP